MKDKDALLLWESYLESAKPDFADIDKDGDKKESMKKAAKDKEEGEETVEETDHSNLRAAKTDEENEADDRKKKGEAKQNAIMKKDLDEEEDVVEEAAMPEDDVFSAIEMAEGGDYRGAIETAVSAIANHMLNDIENTGNGPLDEAETADVWNIKDGIKLAMEDLFGGSNAEVYEALTKNLRNAFHKSSNEPAIDEYQPSPEQDLGY